MKWNNSTGPDWIIGDQKKASSKLKDAIIDLIAVGNHVEDRKILSDSMVN